MSSLKEILTYMFTGQRQRRSDYGYLDFVLRESLRMLFIIFVVVFLYIFLLMTISVIL